MVARDANDTSDEARKKERPGVLIGAAAGVKESFPNDTVAGVGQIFAGISYAHWELAGFGRWELEHDAEGAMEKTANSGKLRYSAVGGGTMAGRRQAVGPIVLVAGVRAAVFGAEEERTGQREPGRPGKKEAAFLDPRLGLYAGCILTETSRVRLRAQVDGDAGLLVHRDEMAELSPFPRWNLGVSVGAEAGFLP
jgi:hypothetical protein